MKLKPPADSSDVSDLEEARAIASRLSAGIFGRAHETPTEPAETPPVRRELARAKAVIAPEPPPAPAFVPPPPPPSPPPAATEPALMPVHEPEPEAVHTPEPESEPLVFSAPKEPPRPQFERWAPERSEDTPEETMALPDSLVPQVVETPAASVEEEEITTETEIETEIETEAEIEVQAPAPEPEAEPEPMPGARFEPSEPQFAHFVPELEGDEESPADLSSVLPVDEPEPEATPPPPPEPEAEPARDTDPGALLPPPAPAAEPDPVDALMDGLMGGPGENTDPLGALADIGVPVAPELAPPPSWTEILERCQAMVGARASMLIGPTGQVIEATDGWPAAGVSAVAGKLLPLLDKKEREGAGGGISVRLGDRILTTWRVDLPEGARITAALLADQPVSLELRAELEDEIRRGQL